MMMDFNAVTLDSGLKLIEYCDEVDLSTEEASKSRQIAQYEVNVMEIVEFCKQLGWLDDSGGILQTTGKSAEILLFDKQTEMLRRMLDMIFQDHHVYWRRFLSRGRRESKLFLEGNQIQILQWCGLFEDDDDASNWWLDQRSYSDEDEDREKASTGRKGERKTLVFEERRTCRKPEWTALELGDREGFDVLSWVDGSIKSDSLRIEVKASSRELEHATFFLTRNEWGKATLGGAHVFHLWPEVYSDEEEPIIVTVEGMKPHVPIDTGDGKWGDAEIPMAAFL